MPRKLVAQFLGDFFGQAIVRQLAEGGSLVGNTGLRAASSASDVTLIAKLEMRILVRGSWAKLGVALRTMIRRVAAIRLISQIVLRSFNAGVIYFALSPAFSPANRPVTIACMRPPV